MLWSGSEGHSHRVSPLVHRSLNSHVLQSHDTHIRPSLSCLAVWRISRSLLRGIRDPVNISSFLIFIQFPFYIDSFAHSTVLLKPHNYSSLCIFFTPLPSHAWPGFNVACNSVAVLLYSHLHCCGVPPPLLPCTPLFFLAYLWSRCSFPSRSPTPRSPGFSLPAGPEILRMKTPVQVAHTGTCLN